MTHEQQSVSFGAYLQTARIESSMSIESLAAETRIRAEVLRRVEAEEHESLPDEVYVRGFIRSYAQAVGADVEEALERYRASRIRLKEEFEGKSAAAARPRRFWLGLAAAVGAVLLMAWLTLQIYSWLTGPPAVPAAVEKPAAVVKPEGFPAAKPVPDMEVEKADTPSSGKPAGTAVADKPDMLPENKPAAASPAAGLQTAEKPQAGLKPYRLEIKATEETWLKIIVDEQNAREITLKPGAIEQVEATAHFNLLIGNAAGVELKLNGTPVAVSGQSGQVVNLELP